MPRIPAKKKSGPTRRLPDTYNNEVISTDRRHVSKGSVNAEQFQFLKDMPDDLSPSGDPKKGRKLEDLTHMRDVGHLMVGRNMNTKKTRSERYRSV